MPQQQNRITQLRLSRGVAFAALFVLFAPFAGAQNPSILSSALLHTGNVHALKENGFAFYILCAEGLQVATASGGGVSLRGSNAEYHYASGRLALSKTGSHVFGTNGTNVLVYSVTNPDAPALVHVIDVGLPVTDATVKDDMLYVAVADTFGIIAYNITNPAMPGPGVRATGALSPADGLPGCILVKSGFLYCATTQGRIAVWNLVTPGAPALFATTTWQETPGTPLDLITDGVTLFALAEGAGVYSVDVTDPAAPGHGATWYLTNPKSIAIDGSVLSVCSPDTLLSLDASQAMSHFSVLQSLGCGNCYFQRLMIWNTVLVTASPGIIRLYNSSLQRVGMANVLDGSASSVALYSDLAYVIDGEAGVKIVNVADPKHPVVVWSIRTSDTALCLAVDSNKLYVGVWPNKFEIYDLWTTPSSPQKLSTVTLLYNTTMEGRPSAISVHGNYAYVSTYTPCCEQNLHGGAQGVAVLRVQPPLSPQITGLYSTPGRPVHVAFRQNVAAITMQNFLFDTSALAVFGKTQIAFASVDTATGALAAMAVASDTIFGTQRPRKSIFLNDSVLAVLLQRDDSTAFFGANTSGLHFLKVDSAGTAHTLSTLALGGVAHDFAVDADTLYVCYKDSVARYDVSIPAAPVFTAKAQSGDRPLGIGLAGGRQYVADHSMLSIMRVEKTVRTLAVTAPLLNERLEAGSTYHIRWSAQGVPGNINIALSTDSGSTFAVPVGVPVSAALGDVAWTVPSLPGTRCMLILCAESGEVLCARSAVFEIHVTPTLTVTAPLQGAHYQPGENIPVTWTSTHLSGPLVAKYSTTGAAPYTQIIDTVDAAAGTLQWTAPPMRSDSVRVQLCTLDTIPLCAESPGLFTVAEIIRSLFITSPTGGEHWKKGTSRIISWSQQNVTGNVIVKLSTDSGTSFARVLATVPATQDTVMWMVDADTSARCVVQVVSADDPALFSSSGVFFVTDNPLVLVLHDGADVPLASVAVNVSRVLPDRSTVVAGSPVTAMDGTIDLAALGIGIGDEIKVERLAYALSCAPGIDHAAVGNVVARIMTDNGSFDIDGTESFPVLAANGEHVRLGHTTVIYNLVVSIEWDASTAYLTALQAWFRSVANYLYDVTDGQLRLGTVAVYDNAQRWHDADVHIVADNEQHPRATPDGVTSVTQRGQEAHLTLPRRWFGEAFNGRNASVPDTWMSTGGDDHVRVIGQQLGAYLMNLGNEDMDRAGRSVLSSSFNPGFMAYPYSHHPSFPAEAQEYASEMSNRSRYADTTRRNTMQWSMHQADCWTAFERRYERSYGGVYCAITRPEERANLGSLTWLPGPNNGGAMTADVGAQVLFDIRNAATGAGDYLLECRDNQGTTLPGATVVLYPSRSAGSGTPRIAEGRSADDGTMRVLGAHPGDEVEANWTPSSGAVSLTRRFAISAVSGFTQGADAVQSDVLLLRPVRGVFPFVPVLQYQPAVPGTATVTFDNLKDPFLNPKLEVQVSTDSLFTYTLTNAGSYRATVPLFTSAKHGGAHGLLSLRMQDSSAIPFAIPLRYAFSDSVPVVFGPAGTCRLSLKAASPAVKGWTVLQSDHPVPNAGLVNAWLKKSLSGVYSISAWPDPASALLDSASLSLQYEFAPGGSPSEVAIYRWNGTQWLQLACTVDAAQHTVSAALTTLGTFGVFPTSAVTEAKPAPIASTLQLSITPQPAVTFATVTVESAEPGQGTLFVFNTLGETVYARDIDLRSLRAGARIDVSSWPSGVYLGAVRLHSGAMSTARMVVVK